MNGEFSVKRAGLCVPSPFMISNSRDRAALILAAVDDLPLSLSIPPGLLDADDPADAGAVIDLFEHDASWLSSLRRFARETECGAAAPAMSARELVTHLGVATARDAALVVQYPCVFGSPSSGHDERESLDDLRQHSVAVACACRMLWERAPHLGDGATAFVCGLLHDIGKIALVACCPRGYARVRKRVRDHHTSLVESERDALGIDHAAIGGHIGARLGLSAQMVDGIRLHHHLFDETDDLATRALPALVQVADEIVNDEGSDGKGGRWARDLNEIAAALDVEEGVLASVARELPDRVRPFAAMFDAGAGDAESPRAAGFSLRGAGSKSPTRESPAEPPARRGWSTAVHSDRAVVRAIRRFAELLGSGAHGATPRRVCEAAAACVRDALGVESCAALLGSCTSDVLFLGAATGERGASVASRSRVMPAWSVKISDVVPVDRPDRAFVKAPEACELIWERCLDTIPRGTLWLLPFVVPSDPLCGEVRGGVLVSTGDRRDARRGMDLPGLDVLATVMGIAGAAAIAHAEQKTDVDRLADEVRRGRELLNEQAHGRMMSTIAALAGGAAHELNNPLSVISGRAQLLLGDCADEATAKALREIKDQAHRASGIVTDLMSFARPDPPLAETFTVADFLDPLFQCWQANSEAEGVRFELLVADRGTTVHADAKQVAEILDAVVANAIAASKQGSARVHINSPSRASDEMVRIVVTDHGVGMARDVLAHALDPFFSFRESGRGRGMGLSRAYRLAEINGGRLRLESKLGSGTTVTIELPSRPTGA
ncbi:MAG: HDOD domain-containing protein [Planctomycetes bacterium]|nr:HDOD domain-containing protein [Planctomycetota bacterium]